MTCYFCGGYTDRHIRISHTSLEVCTGCGEELAEKTHDLTPNMVMGEGVMPPVVPQAIGRAELCLSCGAKIDACICQAVKS